MTKVLSAVRLQFCSGGSKVMLSRDYEEGLVRC